LQFKILADEDVDFRIVTALKNSGYEVISVLREHQGTSDKEVIRLAKRFNALLLTEDSDFGHWVFARKERGISVLFLRYNSNDHIQITDSLIKVLKDYGTSLYGKFVVMTVKKVRIREI
jgi:predicted nuclease of predicted toxin-antitoxin system